MILVGDKRQELYQFKGSKIKYFRNPDKYFNRDFKQKKVKLSRRITSQMAEFINKFYGKVIIKSEKNIQNSVEYHSKNKKEINAFIVESIDGFLKKGYLITDILVLNYVIDIGKSKELCQQMFIDRQWPTE